MDKKKRQYKSYKEGLVLKDEKNKCDENLERSLGMYNTIRKSLAMIKSNLETSLKEDCSDKENIAEQIEYINGVLDKFEKNRYKFMESYNTYTSHVDLFSEKIEGFERRKETALSMLKEVSDLKPYKLAYLIRRTKFQLLKGSSNEKLRYGKWIGKKLFNLKHEDSHVYNPIYDVEVVLKANENNEVDIDQKAADENNSKEYYEKFSSYKEFLYDEDNDNSELISKIEEFPSRGIVVFPSCEGISGPRYMNLLVKLSQMGFLCFYCKGSTGDMGLKRIDDNLYELNNDSYLLSALLSKYALVLCCSYSQMPWADNLHSKFVWYDLSEEHSGEASGLCRLALNADIVSCSSDALKRRLKDINAYYIPDDMNSGQSIMAYDKYNKPVDIINDVIISSYKGLRLFSNMTVYGSVCAFTETFMDFNGDTFYSGGAERYLIDLGEICRSLGLKFNIVQYGNYSWARRFKGFNIISLGDAFLNAVGLQQSSLYSFNRKFYHLSQNKTALSIYSPFSIAVPMVSSPNTGISHGISWDNKYNDFNEGTEFWNAKKRFIESAKKLDSMISVDTNTANWFQTIDYEVGRNIKVIPNYVDVDEFKPDKSEPNEDRIVITYPRRLYEARGLYLTLNIIDEILEKHKNVEFHFVGRGFEDDTKHVDEKIAKWGERVKWYSLLPEEMSKVYKVSDIILIPTMYSEGTSLSCLEAMASGNAVIATRVGGLTDLVIDGFNGFLIGLNDRELLNAVERLITDIDLRNMFSENGVKVAHAFSKKSWSEKWTKVINELSIVRNEIKYEDSKHVRIFIKNKEVLMNNLDVVKKYLLEESFVEIRIDNEELVQSSFGRLQFVPWDAESYYTDPDTVAADKEALGYIDIQADIVLS